MTPRAYRRNSDASASVARHERTPLFTPELKAAGVKRQRRRPRKQHHELAVGDRVLARSAPRPIAGSSGDRFHDLIARQTPIVELRPNEVPEGFRSGLIGRVAKLSHADLRFPHQDVRAIAKIARLLDEAPGHLAGLAGSAAQDFGGLSTRVEMFSNRLDQLGLTTRAGRSPIRLEAIGGQLEEPYRRGAYGTGDRVRPTVPVQQRTLLMRRATGTTAINVSDGCATGLDHVVGRELA